ncbi:MAG TPA: hypothetical protein VN681_13300 [Stellaceae bacterium]|nr:hypothetical protein [Stellaceae bacterium]
MNTELFVSYRTSAPGRWTGAYRVELTPTDDPATGRLSQRGPTYNDVAFYKGVFRTRPEAVRAALEYVGAPCKLVEFTTGGSSDVRLLEIGARFTLDAYTTARVLGSRSERRMSVADEP